MIYGNKEGFNPCFNGSMYKNILNFSHLLSPLTGFNPCFNGSMYKNGILEPFQGLKIVFQSLF